MKNWASRYSLAVNPKVSLKKKNLNESSKKEHIEGLLNISKREG